MRRQTLVGLSFLLSMVIVYGLSFLLRSFHIQVPYIGLISHIVCSLILSPILLIPLARLNRPLLAWRKNRGRDIEEEEKYEIVESDIISLRPRQSDHGKLK